ncbi:unnamed protein product, partial [Gulo gulo]
PGDKGPPRHPGLPALVLRGYSVRTLAVPGEDVPRENRQDVFRAACAGNSGTGGFSSPTVAAVSRSPRGTPGSRLYRHVTGRSSTAAYSPDSVLGHF